MAYLALYRKYRPKFLKDVIGQCSIVKTLQNSIKLQKISHAYIFAGPKGTGKTSISKIFAKAINCENYKNGDACGECNNCKIINEGKTQDILEIDAASNNGIDDVKNLIEKVHYLPMNLNKKIYIIDEAHMLTNQSWNALLKIIEEPPAHVVFIFATTEIYKIPSTISSRCQQFFFNKLIDNDLTILLQEVSKKENINISIDGVKKIITIADGAARDALSILDQLSLATNNNITIADIEESFGLVDDEKKIFLIKLIIEKDIASVMCELDNFSEKGINFYNLCNELIFILLDKLIFLQTNDETLLKRVNKNLLNKFETNVDQTIELINIWQDIAFKTKTSHDTRAYFEIGVFQSFKLFECVEIKKNINQNRTTEVIKKNEKSTETNNDKLPKISEVFKISEMVFSNENSKNNNDDKIKKNENNVTTKKVNLNVEEINFNLDEISLAIGNNQTEEYKKTIETIIEKIKSKNSASFFINQILLAKKVVIASKNGFILLFDNMIDAELFNSFSCKLDSLKEIENEFSKPMYIVGFTKETLDDFVLKFKEQHNKIKKIPEPNIETLVDFIKKNKKNNNSEIFEMAQKLFGDE